MAQARGSRVNLKLLKVLIMIISNECRGRQPECHRETVCVGVCVCLLLVVYF